MLLHIHHPTIVLTGPTASGKTALALELAKTYSDLEIISADSLLFYKKCNIGTAKPSLEEQATIPHHNLDKILPHETINASDFLKHTQQALDSIYERGKRAIIVGGSAFYLKALFFGMWNAPKSSETFRKSLQSSSSLELWDRLSTQDPTTSKKIHPHDRYRIIRALEIIHLTQQPMHQHISHPKSLHPYLYPITIDRTAEELKNLIIQRTHHMIHAGILEETQWLLKKYPDSRVLQAVGYQQVKRYLLNISPPGRTVQPGLAGLVDEITLATQQLVKSQRTWFKSFQNISKTRSFLMDENRVEFNLYFESIYKF